MGADDERRRRGPPAGDAGAATGADPPPDPAPLDASEGGFSEPDAAPMPAAALPPADAARYQVGAFLGRGGMGVVHTARDLHLARDVALKALPADAAGAAAAARLLREARITARLDHPGVLAVHDVGALPDGRAFYTMRLVRGRSLAQALRADEVAPARDLVRHVLAACEAVGYAHAVGLVHRDLKPANVLIGPHGETQVADWGLAAPTPAAAPRWVDLPGPRPAAGGTPGFVALEQARGAPPDPRHDFWSLGAMLAQVAPPADAPLAASSSARRRPIPTNATPTPAPWPQTWRAGSRAGA